MITGNIIGAMTKYKTPDISILVDEDGNEYPAILTADEVVITADENDLRLGETAILKDGIGVGEKFIPSYHTTEGRVIVPNGSEYKITLLRQYDRYNFTKFQAMICDFNTSDIDSTSVHTISLHGNVYSARSDMSMSSVSKNHSDKSISLGIINNTGKPQILRFFTYKEI